ncbi:MAG: hypothetical protein JJ844_00170 [Prochlorococcus marinus CUG1435]|nr:hypothetical protein [Prochlorococcus marinus CUG1435]
MNDLQAIAMNEELINVLRDSIYVVHCRIWRQTNLVDKKKEGWRTSP